MNKNLPKVFAVPIERQIKNNKDIFMSSKREDRGTTINKNEINKIFNSKTHVYKTKVKLRTNTDEKEVEVVGINNDNLLTLDGKSINLNDIIEIKKV